MIDFDSFDSDDSERAPAVDHLADARRALAAAEKRGDSAFWLNILRESVAIELELASAPPPPVQRPSFRVAS
jgi:hypothetical protein